MSDRPPPRRRRATIAEVARLARVSTATAGRVLGGYGYASDDVRERVRQAAEALSYRANHRARGLITGRSRMLGFVAADICDPFYAAVLCGMSVTAQDAGFAVVVSNTWDDPACETREIQRMMSELVDGIVIAPSRLDRHDTLGTVLREGVPVVQIDRLAEGLEADSVTVDNIAAAEACVAAMIAEGHRRIGIVVSLTPGFDGAAPADAPLPGPVMRTTGWQRLAGYRAAHQAAGLPLDPALTAHLPRMGADAAACASHSLLSRAQPPTAIFATDGTIAAGVLDAAYALGLTVPDDLSIGAFDDRDWMAFVPPRITTVVQPSVEIGRQAATMLLSRIGGTGGPARHQTLCAELAIRGSISAPRSVFRA